MDTVVQQLDTKLGQWEPEIAEQVRQFIWEIIQLADQGIPVELMRSRAVEQEVIDHLYRQYSDRQLVQAATQVSEPSLAQVWDNLEDAAYDDL
jgi:hypothetical protein